MKKIIFLFVVLFITLGCRNTSYTKLNQIDSLVAAEEYDSSYHEIKRLNETNFSNEEDLAHYFLLLNQTTYLAGDEMPSDSAIDRAISYYEKNGNHEKLADAYYYKAANHNLKNDFAEAVLLYKQAEEQATKTNNLKLKYKIAESIAYINNLGGNYSLQLNYAKKALSYAIEADNKNWMAYSYFYASIAFQRLEKMDSFTIYTKKIIPLVDEVYPPNKADFLSCIGYMYYKNGDFAQAKSYYEKSLAEEKHARTLENLADIYLDEDNEDAAYELWEQAFLLEEDVPKDNIMLNMLQYDLSHHQNLEDACERVYSIFSIKDSLNHVLTDRSIQELQQTYDSKVAQAEYDKKKWKWSVYLLVAAMVILLLVAYLSYRKYKEKLNLTKQQMLISHYTNEINQLREQSKSAEQQIKSYQTKIVQLNKYEEKVDEYQTIIHSLEDNNEKAKEQIKVLQHKMDELLENNSSRLNRGKILFDKILSNESTKKWNNYDLKCFIEYYKAIHFPAYEVFEKKNSSLTTHNLFIMMLYEMGKNDQEVGQIMGLTPEGVRSARHRIRRRVKE